MPDTKSTRNDLKGPFHFIGIGGVGMSALARLLLDRGFKVSGSDLAASYLTELLVKAGATVHIGHAADHVAADATVIYATGVSERNPEYLKARAEGCPQLHRSDLLAAVALDYKLLAVTGTHGKTTTSALLAHVLRFADKDPAFAVGGLLPQYGTNGAGGKGEYFVVEACESDGTFLKYSPYGAIVTNMDGDHLDYYGSEEALHASFYQFIDSVLAEKHLFWCGDDPVLKVKHCLGVSYGFDEGCELRISNFLQEGWSVTFDVAWQGIHYRRVALPLIGKHNALNGAAVFGLALSLGISENAIREAFLSFQGVKRRCESQGSFRGIRFIDDYAHHPSEIKTTLQGIRQAIGERPLIAVYQPHRHSRTRDCLGTYEDVFDAADEVLLTEVYSAGEAPIAGINDEAVFEDISSSNATTITFVRRHALCEELRDRLPPYAVVVALGAGDITHFGKEMIEFLEKVPPKKLRVGVVFGGRSVEHEISLVSARNVVSGLKSECYDVEYFGISREGAWICGERAQSQLTHHREISASGSLLSSEVLEKLQACDVLFPVLHGPFGEDGTVQGFFDTLNIPYVGCCQRSAAICMDKALTKELMFLHHIPTIDFVSLTRFQWHCFRSAVVADVITKFTFPLFVKPAHLGSSIGVRKVHSTEELIEGIDNAFLYDTKIIVERSVAGREIEFAVLGNDRVKVFNPGEVLTNGQVYDYAAKYGAEGIPTSSKADLSLQLQDEGKTLAKQAYEAAGCKGMARIDFFLDDEGRYWLNEVNPIPGFTAISLYPQICRVNGLELPELLDELIFLALQLASTKASLLLNERSLSKADVYE